MKANHTPRILFGEDAYLKALLYFDIGNMSEALPHVQLAFDQSPTKELGLLLYQVFIREKRYFEVQALAGHSLLSDMRWDLYANLTTEAFNHADFTASAAAGAVAYEIRSDPNLAYNVACAYAGDFKPQEALKWLALAVTGGFGNKVLLASDPDLDSLRSNPEFDLIAARLG